jgi:hypothetical protein
MGMFDWLKIEYDLGEFDFLKEEGNACGFQTKSLFNCMDTYTLSSEGRLLWDNGNDMNYPSRLNFYIPCDDKWYEFEANFDESGKMVKLDVAAGPCPFNYEIPTEDHKIL